MAEAVGRNERLRLVEAATLQTRSMNERAVGLFVKYGWLGDEASNLSPPTPGEIAMLNKSYGGESQAEALNRKMDEAILRLRLENLRGDE